MFGEIAMLLSELANLIDKWDIRILFFSFNKLHFLLLN